MGSSQKFRLPSSLKREKSKSHSQAQTRPSDGKEHKAQHILGLTETDLNTARNESIGSSATTRLPRLSFSDATTDFGSSNVPMEKSELSRDLRLKASSVLLHEEYHADGANSIRSARLKASGSSSTLHSHYEAQKAPLSISQQTSDSSRRDFALRKGLPVVVQSTTPDKDSLRQLRLFSFNKNRDKQESKNLTKQSPQSPVSPARSAVSSHRSSTTSEERAISASSSFLSPFPSNPVPKGRKDVRFQPVSPGSPASSKKLNPPTRSPAIRPEPSHIKVNIRRPKAGVKHWFDGLEGDSSEGESTHEPELQPNFVAGIEMAFQDGRIGPMSKDLSRTSTFMSGSSSQDANPMPSKRSHHTPHHTLRSSAIPPRITTLNAKSSRSSLPRGAPNKSLFPPSKPKACSLASTDLHQISVLDLSSSEDEEPQPVMTDATRNSLPQLRDSIAVESLIESEIEIGTAQAIDTKQTCSVQATPSLRRVYGSQRSCNARSSASRRNKITHRGSTYLSDQPTDPTLEENDLLTSFPPTPTDTPGSRRASFQDSFRSDTASIESRRLMSVTRQEESLLAAMRLKRLASSRSDASSSSRRIQVVRGLENRTTMQRRRAGRSPMGNEVAALPLSRRSDVAPSISSANFDRASCTTFQTNISNDPSLRFSFASFKTDTSADPDSELSLSLGMASPVLLVPSYNLNRLSRATFFSTSTNDSRDGSNSRRESGYLSKLEKLQGVPKREEVSSQDFIDFPYHGWEAKSKLAAATAR